MSVKRDGQLSPSGFGPTSRLTLAGVKRAVGDLGKVPPRTLHLFILQQVAEAKERLESALEFLPQDADSAKARLAIQQEIAQLAREMRVISKDLLMYDAVLKRASTNARKPSSGGNIDFWNVIRGGTGDAPLQPKGEHAEYALVRLDEGSA